MARARGKPRRERDVWVRQAAEGGFANGSALELRDPEVSDSEVSDSVGSAAELSVDDVGARTRVSSAVMGSVVDVDSASSFRPALEVWDGVSCSIVTDDAACFAELEGICAVIRGAGVDVATTTTGVLAVVAAGSLEM